MGTPQVRCLEMHQSGLLASIPTDTRLAPFRNPHDPADLFMYILQQTLGMHADKPLGGGPVDQRDLGAPAVCHTVPQFCPAKQFPAFDQCVDDFPVHLVHVLAREQPGVIAEHPIIIY